MCGRFSIAGFEGIEERFQLEIEFPDLKPNYNVAPSQNVPVIPNNGSNQLALFRWGLIPYWAKDPAIGHKMINARAETVDEKPSFKTCLQRKRCLIVADGFYEWKKEGTTKRPHRITLTNKELFGFAFGTRGSHQPGISSIHALLSQQRLMNLWNLYTIACLSFSQGKLSRCGWTRVLLIAIF